MLLSLPQLSQASNPDKKHQKDARSADTQMTSCRAEALKEHQDPGVHQLASGNLVNNGASELTTEQIKIIVIESIKSNNLDKLDELFENGANSNLDLSVKPGEAPLLNQQQIETLIGWAQKTTYLTSLNLRNNGISAGFAQNIREKLTLQSIKLTNHPIWLSTDLSNQAAEILHRFLPELQRRFGDSVITAGDQLLCQSSGMPVNHTSDMVSENPLSNMVTPTNKEVAAYLHVCSHIVNLLQQLTAMENLPELSETLQGVQSGENSPHLRTKLTAHPTRLSHPGFAALTTLILNLVDKLSDMPPEDSKFDPLNDELTSAIKTFCTTPALRENKPTVEGEHDELLLNTFNTLQNAIKHLGLMLGGTVSVGTWAAGDHDGHPGVTDEIVESAAIRRSERVLTDYSQRLDKLATKISYLDFSHSHQTKNLLALIAATKNRVQATIAAVNNQPTSSTNASRYDNTQQLLDDLKAINTAMQSNLNFQRIANKTLHNLIIRVEAFGLHYASVDLRQNSAVFQKIIGNFYSMQTDIPKNQTYDDLSEEQRVAFLTALIRDPARLNLLVKQTSQLSKTTENELNLIRSALRVQQTISPQAISYQIIANSEQPSDLLEAMVTVMAAGGYDATTKKLAIPIVPLFETLEDLRQCDQIMTGIFQIYQELGIALPDAIQPIMVGYSDSNKDGGILAARIAVFEAVTRLGSAAQQFGQELVIFHGNGGSEARGGGNMNQTVAARPKVGATTELTIQGEAVNHLLASRKAAASNLAELVTANHTRLHNTPLSDETMATHNAILRKLADTSEKHYREFHDSKTFKNVFFALNKMLSSAPTNPGSRPAARTSDNNDLTGVRAITHNTPTTVARMMWQAIFGVGTALESYLNDGGTLEQLRDLYKGSPQFKSILDDIESALAKANPPIAQDIFKLLPEDKQADAQLFFDTWKTEFNLTKKHLLSITYQQELMEKRPEQKALLEQRMTIADGAGQIMTDQIKHNAPPADIAVALSTVINMMGAV